MMSKFKSSSKSIDLEGILSMQVEMGVNFIHICDLIQGVVVLQFLAMKTIIQKPIAIAPREIIFTPY